MTATHCKAVRYSDEMYCSHCGLRWDVNDPEPPACRVDRPAVKKDKHRAAGILAAALARRTQHGN